MPLGSRNVTYPPCSDFPSHLSFPLTLKGGDSVSHSLLFQVNDYITEEIARYDDWCKKFIGVFPADKTDLINEICKTLKERYLPVNHDKVSIEFEEKIQSKGFQKFLEELEKIEELERMQDLDSQISDLLHQQPVEQLQKLLFFMSGNYEMQIDLLDPFGTSLAVQKRQFSIDDVVSKSLRYKFNENLRIQTSQVE